MKKVAILILPVIFTAQACNFLFGDLTGDQGSGNRGIFLSTDSGQTWAESNRVGDEGNISGIQVTNIFIEPTNTDNILVSSFNSGVFASDTRGDSWIALLPSIIAYTAFINPENSEEIFVSGAKNKIATIYKSPDRGGSWIQVFADPVGPSSVTSLIFDPRNSKTLYAGLSTGRILMSVDGGQTWKAQSSLNERVVKLVAFAGTGTLLILSQTGGLRRSTDSGQNWTDIEIAKADRPAQYNDIITDPTNSSIVYLGTDKGLLGSLDFGLSWRKFILPATEGINNVTAMAVNPKDSSQIFAAIRATVYVSGDRGITWRTVSLPTQRTVGKIEIDPNEPNRIYAGLK